MPLPPWNPPNPHIRFKPRPRDKEPRERPEPKPRKVKQPKPRKVKQPKPRKVKQPKPRKVKQPKSPRPLRGGKDWRKLNVELDKIEKKFRTIIKRARLSPFHKMSCENLEDFLDGKYKGTIFKKIDTQWLRSYKVVTNAEKNSHKQFKDLLAKEGRKLKDGESKVIPKELKIHHLEGTRKTDLYYACRKFSIRPKGVFELTRKGNVIMIVGTVGHYFDDTYDFNKGDEFNIPTIGKIKAHEAHLLERYRGAKSYKIKAEWHQRVNGEIRITAFGSKVSYNLQD